MTVHVIRNPVPTPEEMARILGVSSEHLAAIRAIMDAPARQKTTRRTNGAVRTSSRKPVASRARGKR